MAGYVDTSGFFLYEGQVYQVGLCIDCDEPCRDEDLRCTACERRRQ